jgi:two-component system, NtrC family, response regulator HydG
VKLNSGKLKLLDVLRTDDAKGTIEFEHRRMLLLDADAMGLLRKELIEAVGLDRARRILTRFGYACGYRDALSTKEWQGTDNLAEWWSHGPRLHTLEGVVRVHILSSRIDKSLGLFEVDAEWHNSYEAEQHRSHLGITDSPVCWTLVGYASGHASAVFGREVRCYEKECVGKGDTRCLVIARAVDDCDESIRAIEVDYEKENIQVELRCLLEALDRHQKDLQREQAKVGSLESKLQSLGEAMKASSGAEELVGTSAAFRKVIKDVERVASSDMTVLICGETGTGKDVVARVIHANSGRSGHPLVTVNCAALPASLVESELFGHEKGAFTGAFKQKLGRFEIANGGTVFLDEVGELPLDTQAKFLRVLQQGEFERVGGSRTIKVDVRVLAATNRSLEQLMSEGKFREDLFYRLNVFSIHIPPLRQRPDDIVLLAHYFTSRYGNKFKKTFSSIEHQSLEWLQRYYWPGNVRELEHIIERAVLLADDDVLTVDGPFSERQRVPDSVSFNKRSERESLKTLAQMERLYIEEVIRHTNGLIAGKGGAAEVLDLPASTLRHRMKKLGIK